MCPSEVSDIDDHIYAEYADEGLVVYAIASDQDEHKVEAFADGLDIDMPVLLDPDYLLDDAYILNEAFATAAYPKNWLIGPDGRFVYGANIFMPDELIEEIEALLP